jgi:hypothetical protein
VAKYDEEEGRGARHVLEVFRSKVAVSMSLWLFGLTVWVCADTGPTQKSRTWGVFRMRGSILISEGNFVV